MSLISVSDDPYLDWSEPGIGRYLFTMTVVGVVSFTILLIKEYELINKVRGSNIARSKLQVFLVSSLRRFIYGVIRYKLDSHGKNQIVHKGIVLSKFHTQSQAHKSKSLITHPTQDENSKCLYVCPTIT